MTDIQGKKILKMPLGLKAGKLIQAEQTRDSVEQSGALGLIKPSCKSKL